MKENLEHKIVFCIERIANILKTLLWERVKKEKLSPIQIQFLLYLETHSESFCTGSNLAKEFNLTQATVSDSVRVLMKKGLVRKIQSRSDSRIYILKLTEKGKVIVKKLKEWYIPIKKQLELIPQKKKEYVLLFLMDLIVSLQKIGLINVARMCINCVHFKNIKSKGKNRFYCYLTNQFLSRADLKIDCEKNISRI